MRIRDLVVVLVVVVVMLWLVMLLLLLLNCWSTLCRLHKVQHALRQLAILLLLLLLVMLRTTCRLVRLEPLLEAGRGHVATTALVIILVAIVTGRATAAPATTTAKVTRGIVKVIALWMKQKKAELK